MRYQDPSSSMTLREALEELRAAEADLSMQVSESLARSLEAHDVVHILFGLDITDLDEVVAHGWMAFGTTLTHTEMKAVAADLQHRSIARTFAGGHRFWLMIRALPRLLASFLASRRMTKNWPWHDYGVHLDRPLNEIRAEYGIKLPLRGSTTGRPRGPHHFPVAKRA